MAEEISEVCLFMMGKTGHGKSASGNTIVGRRAFKTSPATMSVTGEPSKACCMFNGGQVTVVDTPGLADTSMAEERGPGVLESFFDGISLCPKGFDALILVFRFGIRMTREEREAIAELEGIFGNSIIEQRCIVLITHIDNVDPEEMDGKNVIEWYQTEDRLMTNLFRRCGNRYILFDNRNGDRNSQVEALLTCVGQVNHQTNGRRYTNWLFEITVTVWKQKKVAKKFDEASMKVNSVFGEVTRALAEQKDGSKMDDGIYNKLNEKLEGLNCLIEDLDEKNKQMLEGQIIVIRQLLYHAQREESTQSQLKQHRDMIANLEAQNQTLALQYQKQIRELQRNKLTEFFPNAAESIGKLVINLAVRMLGGDTMEGILKSLEGPSESK